MSIRKLCVSVMFCCVWAAGTSLPIQVVQGNAPKEIRLVSADKYKTLQEALAKERFLYIPPGHYEVKETIRLRGWRGGVILGSGRFSTFLESSADGPILEISDCQELLLANLSVEHNAAKSGSGAIAATGTDPNNLAIASMTIGARVRGESAKIIWKSSGAGLRLAAPGKYAVQGCHFTNCGTGLEVADHGAEVSVMGGNFQSDLVHIRQNAGRLEARSIGFQLALGGADIEIRSAGTGSAHLVDGCRSEGPATFLRVPGSKEKVDVALKANSVKGTRLADYGAAGTLVLGGNAIIESPLPDAQINSLKSTSEDQDTVEKSLGEIKTASRSAVECPGQFGPSRVYSYGNYLANSFDKPGSLVLGGKSVAVSVGDLWNTIRPGDQYVEGGSHLLSSSAFKEARHAVPAGLRLPVRGFQTAFLKTSAIYRPVLIPTVMNIGELVTSVKKYGAVGDGQTDDSLALAKAIEGERDKPLYFPAGRYRVRKPMILQHWRGATFWGDGPERSIIVGGDQGAAATNGCGYTTFVDLGFEVPVGSKAVAFDSNWDNSNVPDSGGGALQANMFYRCCFQGGGIALSIGRGGFMGSEHLMVDCLFRKAAVGLAVGNYNALTNTVVGGTFEELDAAVDQVAGSFNLFGTVLRDIRKSAVHLGNSAHDTFVLDRIQLEGKTQGSFLETGHTGATINVLIDGCRFKRTTQESESHLVGHSAGGSLIFLGCDLGNRQVQKGGSIDNSSLLLIDTRLDNATQVETSGRAKAFLFGQKVQRRR